MQIVLLGTAAGGGSPQWNCNCSVCSSVRAHAAGTVFRTQSSVAISADGQDWFLLNASPDLRGQLERFAPLHPGKATKRNSRIEGVLLTNADLDHTLGLLLMREGGSIPVHATSKVRDALVHAISIGPVLEAFCGVKWIRPPRRLSPLRRRDGTESGLLYQAVGLRGKPPRFVPGAKTFSPGHSIGFRIQDQRTGGRLLFLPDVAGIEPPLIKSMSDCDVLLFDGTFWSEDEMRKSGVGPATAAAMGHWPMAGPNGSLKLLATLPVRHKVYVHLNNTNPVLLENSAEHRAVRKAGVTIGRDGMKLKI